MKKTFKKLFVGALVAISAFTIGMNVKAFAADDDIKLDVGMGGSPVTFFGSAEGDGYAYQGVFSAQGADISAIKYLAITYTGDATAFDELRIEFQNAGGVKWFRQNDEGTLVDADGKMAPNPSDTAQTFVIDLEKSGISEAVDIVHIHDTLGKGVVNILDARYTTTSSVTIDASELDKPEETTAAEGDTVEDATEAPAEETPDVLFADAAIKEYQVGSGYEYAGFASLGGNASACEYLTIAYKGSEGSFLSFRFETVKVDADGVASNKCGAYWIKDLMTDEGKSIPKASKDKVQTAVIKLSDLSGLNKDFNSVHLHQGDIAGCEGKFEILDFRFSKERPSESELSYEEVTEAPEETAAAGDKPAATTAATENSNDSEPMDMTPIFVVLGGVLVAVVAFVVSKKIVK